MIKYYRSFIVLFLIASFSTSAELADTVSKIKPSVVGVGLYAPTNRPKNELRGSGFVIGNGKFVVTNAHVLPEALDEELLQKIAVFVGTGKAAKVRYAEIIAKSDRYDIAVLKIEGTALPAIKLGNNDFLREGESIAFTGFPIGSVLGLYPVTHRGIIAAITPTIVPVSDASKISIRMLKNLRNPYLVYQLDATAYPGNSGSGLYSVETGEIVGIINKVFVQGTKEGVISTPSGITYAIPVKYLRELLEDNGIKEG